MDITDLRVLGTVLMAVAFAAVVFWAFGPSRRKYFDDAANLPFKDEQDEEQDNSTKADSADYGSTDTGPADDKQPGEKQ